MSMLLAGAALLVTVAVLICAALALAATRSVTVALPVLLDLLLAATLLRLTQQPDTYQLAAVALLVLIKRLGSVGLRRAASARRSTRPA